MLITMSGVDCSGKSTQIELLRAHLTGQGSSSHVIWHRPGYSPRMDAMRRAIRRLRPSSLPTSDDPRSRQEIFERARVRRAWVAMALADSYVEYVFHVRWLLARGLTVVCDRYLQDSMLDLELRFPELKVTSRRPARALHYLAPAPDAAFLLMLPWDEMTRRMEAKREPFPDPPSIRDQRFDAYQSMAERGGFHVIHAAAEPQEVHNEVVARLGP